MTKTLSFDLLFSEQTVWAISEKGKNFLATSKLEMALDPKALYARATADGLHIKFETSAVRDAVTK